MTGVRSGTRGERTEGARVRNRRRVAVYGHRRFRRRAVMAVDGDVVWPGAGPSSSVPLSSIVVEALGTFQLAITVLNTPVPPSSTGEVARAR